MNSSTWKNRLFHLLPVTSWLNVADISLRQTIMWVSGKSLTDAVGGWIWPLIFVSWVISAAWIGGIFCGGYHHCMQCAHCAEIPTGPEAAEAEMTRLSRLHWIADGWKWRPAVILGVLLIAGVALNLILNMVIWSAVLFAYLAVIYKDGTIHHVLQPWCPWCRRDGFNEDNWAPVPDPDPEIERTPKKRRILLADPIMSPPK